jgi:phosphoribosylpyrophosphate synthetase
MLAETNSDKSVASSKTTIKQVSSHLEMLSLSHLVDAFMKSAKQDYSREDFWKMIPVMLQQGVAFYVDDGTPKAYCIIVPINLLNKPGALLFQIYSTHPHFTKMLYEHVTKFMEEKGVTNLVALVDQDKVEYFWKNYGARIKQVVMELPLQTKKQIPTKEVDERGDEEEQEGNEKEEGEEVREVEKEEEHAT